MGLCLFPDDDYTEVATKVTGSLSRFGCWNASWKVPTSSGISQARKRVGSPVLADVFEGVAQAVATRSTRGAWLGSVKKFFQSPTGSASTVTNGASAHQHGPPATVLHDKTREGRVIFVGRILPIPAH
jgi:hypothetical protein